MIAVAGQQPLLNGLVHGFGLQTDEHRGTAGGCGGGTEVGNEPRRVGHGLQFPPAGSRPQIERISGLHAQRLASEFDHHCALSIRVAHRDLPGLQDEFVVRRRVFEKGHRSLDPPGLTDNGADHDDDDAQVGEEESGVVLFPRPAHERAANEVGAEEEQPQVEPRCFVNPSAGRISVELRLGNSADDAHDNEHAQQDDRQPQRSEEPEDRIAFPSIPRRARRAGTG